MRNPKLEKRTVEKKDIVPNRTFTIIFYMHDRPIKALVFSGRNRKIIIHIDHLAILV